MWVGYPFIRCLGSYLKPLQCCPGSWDFSTPVSHSPAWKLITYRFHHRRMVPGIISRDWRVSFPTKQIRFLFSGVDAVSISRDRCWALESVVLLLEHNEGKSMIEVEISWRQRLIAAATLEMVTAVLSSAKGPFPVIAASINRHCPRLHLPRSWLNFTARLQCGAGRFGR